VRGGEIYFREGDFISLAGRLHFSLFKLVSLIFFNGETPAPFPDLNWSVSFNYFAKKSIDWIK